MYHALYRFCIANGLKQHVKHPTREHYLLDLAISDLSPRSIEILHAISDHNIVLACFDIGIPEAIGVTRTVFDYGKADWTNMKVLIGHLSIRQMWTMLSDIFTTLCSLSCGDTLQSVCCWNVNRSIPGLTTGVCKLFISKTCPWAHLILLLRHHLAAVYYLMSIYCTSKRCGISWVKNDVGVRAGGELQTI